jgi:hypothetical protein
MIKQGLIQKKDTVGNSRNGRDKRSKRFYILTQKGENIIKHSLKKTNIITNEYLNMIPW